MNKAQAITSSPPLTLQPHLTYTTKQKAILIVATAAITAVGTAFLLLLSGISMPVAIAIILPAAIGTGVITYLFLKRQTNCDLTEDGHMTACDKQSSSENPAVDKLNQKKQIKDPDVVTQTTPKEVEKLETPLDHAEIEQTDDWRAPIRLLSKF